MPISWSRLALTPVSSISSRRHASSTVSPTSTNPPGSAYRPLKGGFPRRISKRRPFASSTSQSVVRAGVLGKGTDFGRSNPQRRFDLLQALVVRRELLAAEHAAVDHDVGGVDEGGAVGGEPQHALGDVVGHAGAGYRLCLGIERLGRVRRFVRAGGRPAQCPWPG